MEDAREGRLEHIAMDCCVLLRQLLNIKMIHQTIRNYHKLLHED